MYALLGDIQFDLITYFDSFEADFGTDYAEHAVIDGKPRLQYMGDRLDEIRIELSFHASFCNPETELARLKNAVSSHEAMALILGNGDYKGWFVLTDVQSTSRQTDESGTLLALDASITLREYVGDRKNPLPSPAVLTNLPPVSALGKLTGKSSLLPGENTVGSGIRQVAGLASQARGALTLASSAIRIAQRLSRNPVAAVKYIPGLLRQTQRITASLGNLSPAIAGLSEQVPEVLALAKPAVSALNTASLAQTTLRHATTGNIAGTLSTAASLLSDSQNALEKGSPVISRLAGMIASRSV